MLQPRFDVKGIVTALGGATVLQRKIEFLGYGAAPGIESVRKWMRRGSIPSDWLASILAISRAEGRPLDLYQYLEVEQ